MNYYNENDPRAAAWLRELIRGGLISDGHVDERSIEQVRPADLAGFTQCHFFAGIGGWSYALRLAGWPDDEPAWTGSCPCQPFSCAGRQRGEADERHLWPVWFDLVRECRPPVIFGEQVASKLGRQWLASIRSDLDGLGYRFGAAGLCARAFGFPHYRMRSFFVADAAEHGCERLLGSVAPQIQKDRTPEALGSWDSAGNPFTDWQEQLAETRVDRLDDGISSCLAVRPACRGYGNAIVPQVAAEFVRAYAWLKQNPTG
jgi:DNA (cytosine-5)-methyltransferase 1